MEWYKFCVLNFWTVVKLFFKNYSFIWWLYQRTRNQEIFIVKLKKICWLWYLPLSYDRIFVMHLLWRSCNCSTQLGMVMGYAIFRAESWPDVNPRHVLYLLCCIPRIPVCDSHFYLFVYLIFSMLYFLSRWNRLLQSCCNHILFIQCFITYSFISAHYPPPMTLIYPLPPPTQPPSRL